MKAAEALIAWTPARETDQPTCGQVKVGHLLHEGEVDWTDPYTSTGGAAHVDRRSYTGWKSIALVFIDFNTLVVGDGLDPKVVHEAFLAIDEYRQRISPDLPGAEDIPEEEVDL